MKDKTVEQAKSILDSSMSKKFDKEVAEVRVMDEMDMTRTSILSFLRDSFDRVTQDDNLKKLVGQKLELMLETDTDLTIANLINLYRVLGDDTTDRLRALLTIMTPASGTASNPFIERPAQEKEDMNKAFDSYDSKDLQGINMLSNKIDQMMAKSDSEKKDKK